MDVVVKPSSEGTVSLTNHISTPVTQITHTHANTLVTHTHLEAVLLNLQKLSPAHQWDANVPNAGVIKQILLVRALARSSG